MDKKILASETGANNPRNGIVRLRSAPVFKKIIFGFSMTRVNRGSNNVNPGQTAFQRGSQDLPFIVTYFFTILLF